MISREPRVLAVGSLLIILGTALLLDRLELLAFRWDKMFWIAAGLTGGFLAVDGFVRKRKGRTFWGTLLLLFSGFQILSNIGLIEPYEFYTVPALFLSFGLAFLCLYAFDPGELAVLIPALVFCGAGVVSLLWWWEIIEANEIGEAVGTYWPMILVLFGLSLLLRRRSAGAPGDQRSG